MNLIVIASVAMSAGVPPVHAGDVSAFACGTAQPVTSTQTSIVEAAYINRSVAIVTAALLNEQDKLRAFVSADATSIDSPFDFEVRSTGGPSAVIKLFKGTAPRGYQLLLGRGLPPPAIKAPCDPFVVTLNLLPIAGGTAQIATFIYKNGKLVELYLKAADFVAGEFQLKR